MAEKHPTIKLTLTELRKGLYRSRIDQSPLGASSGAGSTFTLKPALEKQIKHFIANVPKGALNRQDVSGLGQALFNLIFKDEVLKRYSECVGAASENGATLRLALTILTNRLVSIPWEYLYNNNNFLVYQKHSIIRVIDELGESNTPFGPVHRILLAMANPVDTAYRQFDDQAHLNKLKQIFERMGGIYCKYLLPTTKRKLEMEIADYQYDALYFVGHGRFAEGLGGQLVLEDDNRRADYLDASELAGWIDSTSSGSRINFVYLNACSTAETSINSPFAGVAQRLIGNGTVAAVVAMQTAIEQAPALKIAENFFNKLRNGESPERAASQARTNSGNFYTLGIPTIYSHLAGPEQFYKNRIASLLSANKNSSYAFFLPTFKKGVPVEMKEDEMSQVDRSGDHIYSRDTFAEKDLDSAWDVLKLITQITPLDKIRMLRTTDTNNKSGDNFSHWLFFGSRSNTFMARTLGIRSDFRFDYNKRDNNKWTLIDAKNNDHPYPIDDPSKLDLQANESGDDLGVIEKKRFGTGVYFIFSGLGDKATRACGYYFLQHWEDLLNEFGSEDFGIILSCPRGMDRGERIQRLITNI